jgi:hypothetical protein
MIKEKKLVPKTRKTAKVLLQIMTQKKVITSLKSLTYSSL